MIDGGPPMCVIDYKINGERDGSVSVTYPAEPAEGCITLWNKELETSNLRRLAKNGNARAQGLMLDIRNGLTRPVDLLLSRYLYQEW